MIEEIWRPIPGYEGLYEVSNLGRVRSLDRITISAYFPNGHPFKGKILSPSHNKYPGYEILVLRKDKKSESHYVHRLVASAFLPNPHPEKYNTINHKDENKHNNEVGNLEWCDDTYNLNYGTARKRRAETIVRRQPRNAPKPIEQYTLDNQYIASFSSVCEMERMIGICAQTVDSALRRNNGHCVSMGYIWKYSTLSLPQR